MTNLISKASDLETTYEDTKLGFLAIALRKSKEAQYYLNLAQAFRSEVETHIDPHDLLKVKDIESSMCQAAGLSMKATAYIDEADIPDLITVFIDEYLAPLGKEYVDQLVSRYLLTQGDALGGRMRNVIGKLGSEKLIEQVIAVLTVRSFEFEYLLNNGNREWCKGDDFQNDHTSLVKAIRWVAGEKRRILFFDLKVPAVNKNVDIVLFDSINFVSLKPKVFKEFISNTTNYLALGELKSGIDPAGADEHWKTASTSLSRIKRAFDSHDHTVSTLFIGAAIEAAMAQEMFDQTQSGDLTRCANLTKSRQVLSVCKWLVDM
jgi:hypothetical protein